MSLSVALRIWNIWKCKGLFFAQFLPNTHQSSSYWLKTTQIFNEKCRHPIFVKNLGNMDKKREGGVCQGWNFWEWQMRSLPKNNLKIAFLAVAPFIVKFRFEKLTNEKEARWILNQWERRVTNIFIWNNEISKKWEQWKSFCKKDWLIVQCIWSI